MGNLQCSSIEDLAWESCGQLPATITSRTTHCGVNTVYCVQVEVSKLDVSSLPETEEMLEDAQKMAPVAGIFHLAMVLTDKWIANQVTKESIMQED